jgi:putative FmdB family regulatory protein
LSARAAILRIVATYEYLCLACERPFEERRAMTSSVETALACPSCGSDRIRRRFSFAASVGSDRGSAAGGCACGGACACGH